MTHTEEVITGRTAPMIGTGRTVCGSEGGGSFPHLEAESMRIIDRKEDLAAVTSLLLGEDGRLLTLTGPGGVGKTRLALEAGRALQNDFPDGVVFVDLAAVCEPARVFDALAQQIMADGATAGRTALERLRAILHDRAMLIILDNVEQVLPAASGLSELLASAPRVVMLATSREPLRLRWEQVYRVPPLPVPDLAQLPPLAELAQVPSVALFLQRARFLSPHFAFTEDNARDIASLCVHLDGMPLAIELAAARSTLMSPHTILERLDQRLSLFHWNAQDLPERQQSLTAAIDWSYDLLSPAEQTLFRCLGIFTGTFSLEAVEAVAGRPRERTLQPNVIDGLAALIDKSLVQVRDMTKGGDLYSLLESVRAYALERLEAAGELEDVAHAHALYYRALVEQAARGLSGPQRPEWLLMVEEKQDNLRAAHQWLLQHDHDQPALSPTSDLFSRVLDEMHAESARQLEARRAEDRRNFLSRREQEVLCVVAEGLSNKQIARELIVAESTVRYHLTSIFNKLGVDTRAHAVAVAAQRGLL